MPLLLNPPPPASSLALVPPLPLPTQKCPCLSHCPPPPQAYWLKSSADDGISSHCRPHSTLAPSMGRGYEVTITEPPAPPPPIPLQSLTTNPAPRRAPFWSKLRQAGRKADQRSRFFTISFTRVLSSLPHGTHGRGNTTPLCFTHQRNMSSDCILTLPLAARIWLQDSILLFKESMGY